MGNLLTTDGVLAGTADRVSMTYDRAGRKLSMSDPDKGFWQYRYDVLGQLQCQQDAKGQLTVYTYDKLGRETQRVHYPAGTVTTCVGSGTVQGTFTWTYDTISGTGTTRGQLTADSANHNGFVQSRSYQYDSFGRLFGVSTSMDGRTWFEETTYDQFGRLFQQFDAAGDELNQPLGVRYVYNGQGHLTELKEAAHGAVGKVYVQYQAQDARGQISRTAYGNGQVTDRLFDPVTGLIQWIGTGSATTAGVQDLSYTFDMVGNLKQRWDQSQFRNQKEDFVYDGLNRLKSVTLTAPDLGLNNFPTLDVTYNAAGNITSKTGVGNYSYPTTGRIHGVTSAGTVNYGYDLNGNVTSDTTDKIGRAFTYTAFERLFQATKGSNWSQYFYAPDLNWVKRQTQGDDAATATFETLWRIGNVEISEKNGIRELRRTIGGEVQISYWNTNPQGQERYLHKDRVGVPLGLLSSTMKTAQVGTISGQYIAAQALRRLWRGSIDAITDAAGNVIDAMSFTAFGERRDIADWRIGESLMGIDALRAITSKGFTGHEMVDAVGIIHMGGRIYDPRLGRFLQADPFVQAPDNSQNLNRYSYVLNNPLSFTDPTGFFFGGLFKFLKIGAALGIGVFTGGVGLGAFTFLGISGGLAGVGIAAAGGFISGALLAGNIKGALIGAFTSFLFAGVGQQIAQAAGAAGSGILGTGLNAGQLLGATAITGFLGGVLSEVQGGKFGHAFLSSGITSLLSPALGRIKDTLARGLANAVLGGTVSRITSGKFASGASLF